MNRLQYIKDVPALATKVAEQIAWHRERYALTEYVSLWLTNMWQPNKPTVRVARRLEEYLRSCYTHDQLSVRYTPPDIWFVGEHARLQLTVTGATSDGEGVAYQLWMDATYKLDIARTLVGHQLYKHFADGLSARLPLLASAAAKYNKHLRALAELSDFAKCDPNPVLSGGSPMAPLTEAFAWYELPHD